MSHNAANQQVDEAAVEHLKTKLMETFSVPETSYKPLTAAEVISRNRPEINWHPGEYIQNN